MPATLSIDRLFEVLDYEGSTGVFRWRIGRNKCKQYAIAGSPSPNGYWRICIDGKRYLAHRLAVFYATLEMPAIVDHIDGNKLNNRIDNLRSATVAINARNRAIAASTGTRQSRNGVWSAYISVNRHRIHLGSFDTQEKAAAAYLHAKTKLHPESRYSVAEVPMPPSRQHVIGRSGVRGVTWAKSAGKWECKVKVNGKYVRLGRFDDIDKAKAAYEQGRAKYGLPPNGMETQRTAYL